VVPSGLALSGVSRIGEGGRRAQGAEPTGFEAVVVGRVAVGFDQWVDKGGERQMEGEWLLGLAGGHPWAPCGEWGFR
jgi:hypothetical protein